MITTTKMFLWAAVPLALAITLVGSAVYAGEAKRAAKNAHLVIAPHTPEECLAALDGFALRRKLEIFEFGCTHGDHTGYARIEAKSEADALASVPERERPRARAVQLVHERYVREWLANQAAGGPGRERGALGPGEVRGRERGLVPGERLRPRRPLRLAP